MRLHRSSAVVSLPLALAVLGLSACNRQSVQAPAPPATGAPIASLPLAQGAPPTPALAPPVAALPPASPVRVAHATGRQRYRYIDRAYALGEAFAESPPDYTVDYQGERPWIWRSAHGDYRMVEPTPQGERTYYFEAGSTEPYLVRDPDWAYGYDQGALVVVYDAAGRPVDEDPEAAEWAARDLERARALYWAAVHQQRQAAYAEAWRERREQIFAEQQAWAAEQQRDAEWSAWREDHRRTEAAQWDAERALRVAYAAQVAAQIAAAEAQPRPSPGAFAPPRDRYGVPAQPQPWWRPGQAPPRGEQQRLQAAARHQAQAEAVSRAQAQAAQQAAAHQQAEAAARAQQQAQADAVRRAKAQAAPQTVAHQQAEAAAIARQQAQADAVRRGQAQAVQQAAARQHAEAAARAQHPNAHARDGRKDETKDQAPG